MLLILFLVNFIKQKIDLIILLFISGLPTNIFSFFSSIFFNKKELQNISKKSKNVLLLYNNIYGSSGQKGSFKSFIIIIFILLLEIL